MEQPDKEIENQAGLENDPPGRPFSWLVWPCFVFAAYVLAVGPAVKLAHAAPKARPTLGTIYFWVDPLARACPQFDSALRWYVKNVWRVK